MAAYVSVSNLLEAKHTNFITEHQHEGGVRTNRSRSLDFRLVSAKKRPIHPTTSSVSLHIRAQTSLRA